MSAQYPDLTLTNFPSSVDQFMTFLNVVASDGPLIEQYLEAMNAGNQTQANQILAQIPQASQKLITATDLNTLSQAMLAVERFYLTDIEPYMNELQQSWTQTIRQFSYQGVWSSGTSYVVNNLVSYTVSGINLVYIATSNPPVGTVPTNSNYWRLLTIQGQQGTSGQGVSYRQEWTNSATYSVNDCVTYNADLWMAIASSQNQEPTNNSQYWQLIMNLEVTTYPIQDTEPTNLQVNGLWFNTQENPTPYYYLEPLTNPITEEMVPVGYQAYTTNGVVLDGTGPLPISSGGTGSSTPQAALSALGAGVRPRLGINMDFQVNQRGQTSYTASGKTYTVDGWYLSSTGMTCAVGDGQVTITPNGNKYNAFIQILEQNYANGTFTFSVLASGASGQTAGIAVLDNATSQMYVRQGFVLQDGLNLLTVTAQIPESSPGQSVILYPDLANGTAPATFYSAKPEEGEGQTLAYKDSTGAWHRLPQPEDGDYAGQLAKCQAYQVVINTLDIIGTTNNATTLYANIPTPVTMRAIPAIENNGVFSVRGGGTNQANLTAATYNSSLNANGIRVGIAGQFTVNEPYSVSIYSPIILNANL